MSFLREPLGHFGQHGNTARIIDGTVANLVCRIVGRTNAKMVPMPHIEHSTAAFLLSAKLAYHIGAVEPVDIGHDIKVGINAQGFTCIVGPLGVRPQFIPITSGCSHQSNRKFGAYGAFKLRSLFTAFQPDRARQQLPPQNRPIALAITYKNDSLCTGRNQRLPPCAR